MWWNCWTEQTVNMLVAVCRCKLSGFGCKLPKDGWDAKTLANWNDARWGEFIKMFLAIYISRSESTQDAMCMQPNDALASAKGQLEQNTKSFSLC